jgi:anthranilate synthase component I
MGGRPLRLLARELSLPASVLLRLAESRADAYPVLFDSASQGPLARHSVLVATRGAALWVDADGRLQARGEAQGHLPGAAGFLDALERWWLAESSAAPLEPAGEPWCGGFAVFASYELASEIEPSLRLPPSDLPCRAYALRVDGALVFDHARGSLVALAEPGRPARRGSSSWSAMPPGAA